MIQITEAAVFDALRHVQEPELGRDIVTLNMVKDVAIEGERVAFTMELTTPACPLKDEIETNAKHALEALGATEVAITWAAMVRRAAPAGTTQLLPDVKNIIAVASGKGGVGKSTTAVNLALGLAALGLRVGVLDADIYGPSLPKLLAIKERPQTLGGTRLKPITRYGLTVMSIGFLIDEETPMIWRGPMVISALTQMLREVEWGTLDVMVVDMPPGTGDAQLTMAQQVPLKGAVIVSTPQDLALIDARRGISMFKRVNVPVLGVIENMSYFLCPHCGTRSDIFSHGGARHEAERLGVPFLGEVPLHMTIREKSDAGLPVVATEPDGPHAKIYRDIAARVRDQLKGAAAGRAAPKIVIEA
jgi:ATP-binding protein involved in chromosome partitioning